MNPVGAPRRARNLRNRDRVDREFGRDPTTSVRKVERRTGLSRTTVHRIIKVAGWHPYHYTRVQGLLPRDSDPRIVYSCWLLNQNERDPTFLENIIFTDESNFGRTGTWNSRNFHA